MVARVTLDDDGLVGVQQVSHHWRQLARDLQWKIYDFTLRLKLNPLDQVIKQNSLS